MSTDPAIADVIGRLGGDAELAAVELERPDSRPGRAATDAPSEREPARGAAVLPRIDAS